MRRMRARLALTGVLALGLFASTLHPAGAIEPTEISPLPRSATAIPAGVLPETGALFGAYVNPTGPDTPAGLMAQLAARESLLGRQLDIHTLFFGFRQPLADPVVTADVQAGRIPLISWAGANTQGVWLGYYDSLIQTQARALRDLGGPIIVRWGWEMEGKRNRDWALSPTDFILAWRHIVDIFRKEGAANVMFAWVGIAVSFTNGVAPPWYPGDYYVDWIGVDGYNWNPGRPSFPWLTFEQIFTPFYAWAAPKDKPLIIAEFGVQERAEGEKAAWFDAVDDALVTKFPDVRAVCYFDTSGRYDWRIDTSSSSLASFTALALDPYLNTQAA